MTDEQLYDKIEAYLLGELPPAEAEAFARQIESDPALAEQVDLHRLEHDAMEVLLERELRAEVGEWLREVKGAGDAGGGAPPGGEDENRPRLVPLRRWLWLAAILVGAAFVGVMFIRQPWAVPSPPVVEQREAPPSEEQSPDVDPAVPPDEEAPVAEQQPETPPAPEREIPSKQQLAEPSPELLALADEVFDDPFFDSAVRGQSATAPTEAPATVDNPYAAAAAAYQERQFDRARRLALAVPANDPDYGDARLLAGRSLYWQGRFRQAAEAFRQILSDPAIAPDDAMLRDLIRQTAEWNLLVANLAQGLSTRAVVEDLLEQIAADEKHRYRQEAKKLQDKLSQVYR